MAELRWGTATDPGRVRPGNEDSVLAVAQVFAVADGMGGHAAGEVASAVALQTIAARIGQRPASIASVTDVVRAANEAVYRRSLAEPTDPRHGHHARPGGAGTGADGKDHLVVANVGDSRVYLCTDGELRQLTRDHSYVEEMLAAGQITADEARRHPHRHVVTRVVGIEPSVAVDTWLVTPEPGDRYLICSDGLVDEVTDEDIARIITAAPDPQTAADTLVTAANEAGGRDNISVVVVEVLGLGRQPQLGRRRAGDHRRPRRPPSRSAAGSPTTWPTASTQSRRRHRPAARRCCRKREHRSRRNHQAQATRGHRPHHRVHEPRRGRVRRGVRRHRRVRASRLLRRLPGRRGRRVPGTARGRALVQAHGGVGQRGHASRATPEFRSRIAGHPTFDSSVAARRVRRAAGENQRALVADTTTTTVVAPSTSAVSASSVVTIAP